MIKVDKSGYEWYFTSGTRKGFTLVVTQVVLMNKIANSKLPARESLLEGFRRILEDAFPEETAEAVSSAARAASTRKK
ncbi:MAG: hypothetical protein Q4C03_01850 [bacterium]|nr:hypothetical protein [bacterium]